MSFNEALKILNIEDYSDKIFNSNSKGELTHLQQYISLAEILENNSSWFRPWFEETVNWTNENWERPESVYQHIVRILQDQLALLKTTKQ